MTVQYLVYGNLSQSISVIPELSSLTTSSIPRAFSESTESLVFHDFLCRLGNSCRISLLRGVVFQRLPRKPTVRPGNKAISYKIVLRW